MHGRRVWETSPRDLVSLDDLLRRYGADADPARRELQGFAAPKTGTVFVPTDSVTQVGLGTEVVALHGVEDAIPGLHPGDVPQPSAASAAWDDIFLQPDESDGGAG